MDPRLDMILWPGTWLLYHGTQDVLRSNPDFERPGLLDDLNAWQAYFYILSRVWTKQMIQCFVLMNCKDPESIYIHA